MQELLLASRGLLCIGRPAAFLLGRLRLLIEYVPNGRHRWLGNKQTATCKGRLIRAERTFQRGRLNWSLETLRSDMAMAMTRSGSRRARLIDDTVKPVAALIDCSSPWERHITPIGDDAVLSYKVDDHFWRDIARLDDLGQYFELLVRIQAHVPRVHSVTSRRSNEEEEKKANMYYKEIGPSLRYEKGSRQVVFLVSSSD